MSVRPITTRAPAKVILFGEHAINRGQPALATSVGLYATCRLAPGTGRGITLRAAPLGGPAREATVTRDEVLRLGRTVDAWRAAEDYEAVRRLAGADFFAPVKFILAGALGDELPAELDLTFASEVPRAGGLGSGGAIFAALARALAAWTGSDGAGAEARERVAGWAHRGDLIAHGGVASRLDTQTSLCGGVIRFDAAAGLGEPVPHDSGLTLVIGNTGVVAATAEVNSRVRAWLGARPAARLRYFEAIGVLSRAALDPLRRGDWAQLGGLMTLNQVLLEKIGVSSPEIERLVEGALEGGALGAKLAGSGGGGITIALTDPQTAPAVAAAVARAGGEPLTPSLAVPGAAVLQEEEQE